MNTKSKFYKLLIFTIMKKQILFLALFSLTMIFAGMKSYAQDLDYLPATNCAPVTNLTCATNDELHPLPGKIYTYTVGVSPAVAAGGNVRWFVYNATTNQNIITAGSMAAAIAAAEADGGGSQFLLDAENAPYNSATNTDPSIDISWQSFNGTTNAILLVAYVQGNGTPSCADNIEVWRIEPTFAFTLDIAGLMPTGALPTGNAVECLTSVQSASYNGTELVMDYGENYVFFSVTAANFVHSWQPTFGLANNTQTTITNATDITWAYPSEAIKSTGGTWNAITAPVLAQAASGAVGATGECIIVRVRLDHNKAENDNTNPRNIELTVDGIMRNAATSDYTTATLSDLDNVASGPCAVGSNDKATYDLTPRPAITESNPVAPLIFEPKN
ncbi:MAG: hypothetical protein JNK09_22055 [Prolixibacteraceae bacterium]|nr:hypothetical protein [Prolixibacteraceae bacterium]